ncbi:MAG: (deoxy)nucleoside triphosphate pyrophosphohydrolase [Clostridia bacterium]|nr:(deoxy)nucleoside triphosphate pyrophosphohydrolase [Clostridia bacterium]
MTDVVAALIFREDRFLICKRPPDKKRGGLWEFVGGKTEPGESGGEALRRECREELDIDVSVGERLITVLHEYPDVTIRLSLYRCEIAGGEPELKEHTDLRWITPGEADGFEFCPADDGIIKFIKDIYGRNEQ